MSDEGDGVDPLLGSALAKAAGQSGEEAGREAGGIFRRVLGPSADVIGDALAQYTEYRLRNVKKIVDRADEKTHRSTGEVPPRIAHKILEDGSYSDDEIMAEYLSGVLAGSRTPGGVDDRGVTWTATVTSLSSMQLRGHFLLYRAWAAALRGRSDINLAVDQGRNQSKMKLALGEFILALVPGNDPGVDFDAILSHVVTGLMRAGLIGDNYGYGGENGPVLVVRPTVAGVELYGWAQGEPNGTSAWLVARASDFEGVDLPRIQASLPDLPDAPAV